ncbi:MAG: gliding motility-associated C-terminal domain-containing protein [Saprospiraceae bacterium]|nr:gliding motility-associated C-terminal domain-containing protein [Saprospiraceae bacterium]
MKNFAFQKKLFFISLIVFMMLGSIAISFGQNTNNWCFGNYAGVDFSNSPPTAYTTSLMSTPEGCASISDLSGYLELYTNGKKLWSCSHQIITDDLNGSIYSTQSALLIRHPNSIKKQTFLFTTDAMGGSHGLQYTTLVNDVIESKNNPLLANATERITVALHCNGHDFWIITHGWNSNAFYAYKLTKHGLETTPSISYAGSVHSGNYSNGAGYLKASPKSNYLAQAIMGDGKLEIFRFDNQNGVVYDPITIPNIQDAYGVEFSKGEQYLYASSASGSIYQFGIYNYTTYDIIDTKKEILNSTHLIGAMQLASDKKIYVSVDNKNYLAAITLPHNGGSACNYDPNHLYLNGRKTEAGLPPIIPEITEIEIQFSGTCVGDTTFFDVVSHQFLIDSLFWDFGDNSSTTDTSSEKSPLYIYPATGSYDITLYAYYCGSVDTIEHQIEIRDKPGVFLPSDSTFCENKTYTLDGGLGPFYLWSTGSANKTIQVTAPGLYWVKAWNDCGASYDTTEITNIWPVPYISLPSDTNICEGDSIVLFAGDSNYTFIWQSNYSGLFYTAKNAGNYMLTAINQYNCESSDYFNLSITNEPKTNLGNDTNLCKGYSIILDAGYGGDYLWNNGLTTQYYTADSTELIIVEVSNKCGSTIDSIYVQVEDCERKIFVPNCFTPNGDGENDLFFPMGYSLDWSTLSFYIYNRWGELLYFTHDVNKGWDGTKDGGKLCQLGVYAWLVTVKDIYGNEVKLTGTVTLLR